MSSLSAPVRACVFDAYGTLFDVHAPTARVAGRIGDAADALSRLWRQKQLEYTWLRSLMGAYTDFWQITQDALDYALSTHGIDDALLRQALLDLYFRLDAYADAAPVLHELKVRGMATAILSNGSPDMLNAAVASAGLDAHLDHALSVADVGIFKPDDRVYQFAVDTLGVAREEIGFVSANGWDAAGAAHFGFQVVWLNRFKMTQENLPGKPRAVVTGLSDLPGLIPQ